MARVKDLLLKPLRRLLPAASVPSRSDLDSRLRRQVAAVLAPGADERILELGCGTGEGLALLHQREPELGLIGVDQPGPNIERARRRFRRALAAGQIELVAAEADALPFADHSFDAAYRIVTAEAGPDPSLADVYRVLRPGGRLIVGLGAPAHHQADPGADASSADQRYNQLATALGRTGFRYIRMLADPTHQLATIRAERPENSSP